MTAPTEMAINGRTRSGRFAKGHQGGPGRPRGIDFRAVVAAKAEADGITIEDALWDIFKALLARARRGNVAAAKFLVERLCGKDPDEVNIRLDQPRVLSDVERAHRIRAILDGARTRSDLAAK